MADNEAALLDQLSDAPVHHVSAATLPPADEWRDGMVWSDPEQRGRQVGAFLRWLPAELHAHESIDWTSIPGSLMGRLVNAVDLKAWWAIPTLLACGHTAKENLAQHTQYQRAACLLRFWNRLASQGVTSLARLSDRETWHTLLRGTSITGGFRNEIESYAAYAETVQYFSAEEEDDGGAWKHYMLPTPPERVLGTYKLHRIVLNDQQRRRKAETEVVLPLQPFLVNLALYRKQAATKVNEQYTDACKRADAGEITLPYPFTIHTTNPVIVSDHATSVADLKIRLEEIDVPVTLWNRATWTLDHEHGAPIRSNARTGHGTFARESYLLQFRCSPSHVLWFGDILAAGLFYFLPSARHTKYRNAEREQAARELGFPSGAATQNGGLLNSHVSTSRYLSRNAAPEDLLVDWASLYRGILYGAALAVVSLTSAARTCEIQQISMDHWVKRDVEEISAGVKLGRSIRIYLQHLLPKGCTKEEERQLFLISPQAMPLLWEIGKGLADNPKEIPLARNSRNTKAEHLSRERYLFQWRDPEARLARSDLAPVLGGGDINVLLRFVFHGVQLSVPGSGRIFPFTVHLLRHVLATYARHRAHIPPEAVAFLLHHRLRIAGTYPGGLQAGEATEYYSKEPEGDSITQLVALQQEAFLTDAAITIAPLTEKDHDELDADLRDTIEHWGTIGTTTLGFCKAGACVRREDRALCIGCPYLVVYYRMLHHAHSWRGIIVQDIDRHRLEGNHVEARQQQVRLKHLDGYINAMEMQIQVLADGGQLPPHFAIAAQYGQPVEVFDRA